jgi:hypothetical protein
MFAIVEIIKNSLYSIKYNEVQDEYENDEFGDISSKDIFTRIFNNWNDVEYLDFFFNKHKEDLQRDFFNNISIEEAICQTIEEANELEDLILQIAEAGKTNKTQTLQTLFKPLHKKDKDKFPVPDHQKSKLYGIKRKSWLRVYAIRIDENVFIVTGGAIKLTQTMNEREHLEKELKNLEGVKQFLIENEIIDKDSIEDFMIEF